MSVLRFIGFLIRLALAPFWAAWIALRRRLPRNAWIQVDVDGPVVEFPAVRRPTLPFLAGGQRVVALSALHEIADRLPNAPRVRGVLFVIRNLGAGMATATSLRKAIMRLRETGREVVVYLQNGGDTKELYVASAANRIVVAPHATLAPVGFVSSSRYAKRTLDKLGIAADRLAAGDYKSAGETLALDKMSDAQREQLGAVLDAFYDGLIDALSAGRNVDRERAKALVDGAPYSSEKAVLAGLIDAAAYEDQLPALLAKNGENAHFVSAQRFLAARRARILPRLGRRPVLAVLPLHGAITSGSGPLAMDERFISAVRAARSSRRVRGVVLHIDSPGGSALASDRMYHELTQLAREKPVVAYFGNVAASGGYYAAAAAHHIVAEPTTITGSIGVIAARLVVEPLLDKLGIVTETIKRGAHAAVLDPLHRVDEDERAALEGEIQNFYDAFVGVVAEGRKWTREAVHAVAQGRVWSGRDAKEKGLVDELGDGRAAIAALRSRVGEGAERMEVIAVRPPWQRHPPLAPAAVLDLLGIDGDAVALAFSHDRVLALAALPRIL
ncbi:MAG TPA: signal peptide peptidase SppA [Polyangiaceae bacterium]|jgi:protease-4